MIDPAQRILATNAGSGSMSGPQPVRTHGSHMFSATCVGGDEVTVVTSDGLRTPVPCTGFTSRMRFIADQVAGAQAYRILAESGVEWAISWTDYEPES